MNPRHNAIGTEKASQRRIVIPCIVEQQARARILALVGVIELGTRNRARTDWTPKIEGLQRAGHAVGVRGQAHRAEVVAVDVGEDVRRGGDGAEGHAVNAFSSSLTIKQKQSIPLLSLVEGEEEEYDISLCV